MRGVASLTGSIWPIMVANIVIESMIATPGSREYNSSISDEGGLVLKDVL
jgi:hypothetical protein